MKKVVTLFLALLMVLSLFTNVTAEAPKPITLKLSQTAKMDEHHGAIWYSFADFIHEKLPWITIEVYSSSTLYDDSTFVDAIMRGNVEMGITAPGYLGEYAPETAIFGACYIFQNVDQLNKILNGEVGMEIYDKVAQNTGIRLIGAIYKGRRTINLTSDKKITSRADLNGVLLRVPNADSWMKMGYALGATPTAMALSEVYLALQAGTIDGQDNPLQATMNYGFGEVTKSITMTNHVIDLNWLCISEEIWQSFDEETKAVFMEGLKIAYETCFAAYDGEEASLIAKFREMGVSVYDDIDLSTMEKEVWEYYWAHPEISGGWDKDVYEAIQNAK